MSYDNKKVADYINEVVGKPWRAGATGADAYDCWGLVVDSYRRIDGIKLPPLESYSKLDLVNGINEAMAVGKWHKLNEPIDGCVIACFKGGKLDHVGRYFFGEMLHSRGKVDSDGEVCMWTMELTARQFDKLEFYAWR